MTGIKLLFRSLFFSLALYLAMIAFNTWVSHLNEIP